MESNESIEKRLTPETQKFFRVIWESIPPTERSELLKLLSGIPSEKRLLQLLIDQSAAHLKTAFGNKNRVVIVGPANVGKSTLYNQFIRSKRDQAKVSPVPGTTRTKQTADAGLFAVIDTPGADAVGELGEQEQEEAYFAAEGADFLIIVFDAIQGVKKNELDIFQQLIALGKPYVVALNKVDLVKRHTKRVVNRVAANLGLNPEQVIPIVAKSGKNIDQLLMSVAVIEPEIVAALGRALPQFRWKLAWRSIVSAASMAAAIALIPLPVVDFGPLLVTQSVMVIGIARIYNYKINLQRAKEMVVTFGLGFLGRTLFQQLSKLGGIPGWVLSAAIASSITVTMGYAAAIWFERGEKISSQSIKMITRELTAYLLDALRGLGKRKPGKKRLKQRIAELLEKSPMAEDRTILDEKSQP